LLLLGWSLSSFLLVGGAGIPDPRRVCFCFISLTVKPVH
jgi:hypothetical protein